MIDLSLFRKLHAEGLVSESSFEKIKTNADAGLVSVHWELKTLLYLGVTLLSGGLGILIYKNIDTIGHTVILAIIALICAACFLYCLKKKPPFSFGKTESPSLFFDYALLLGCLTFLSFIAYLQFQYNVFGNRYGLATFIPLCVLFFSAYYFDHLGVLSMAITNFAAWLGLTITPMHILESNDFNSNRIIYSGLLLSLLLLAAAYISKKKSFKPHFEFTYTNFGSHLLFISFLAALFSFGNIYLLLFTGFAFIVFLFYKKAMAEKSFYLLFITVIYGFIGLSYVVIQLLTSFGYEMGIIYLLLLYFILSGFGLIRFLMSANKILKTI